MVQVGQRSGGSVKRGFTVNKLSMGGKCSV